MEPRALLLILVIFPSAAEEVKNLTGTVGRSITLLEPVMGLTFISYGKMTVAMVNNGKLKIVEKTYENRLRWNNITGDFTITDLQRNDSGIYNIDAKETGVVTSYGLSVFDSVSAPAVNTQSVSADSCTLLCAVNNAAETTLLWYKDEEVVKQNSSTLSLSLTVHTQDYDSSYRCVAANPAEEKTVSVNVNSTCDPKQPGRIHGNEARHRVIGIVVPVVSAVVIAVVAFVIKKGLHKDKNATRATQDPEDTETDVQYTHLQFSESRQGQERENIPEPSGDRDRTQLRTVYDKLEVHRLVSTDISHSQGT